MVFASIKDVSLPYFNLVIK